jgi:hypothetical protein
MPDLLLVDLPARRELDTSPNPTWTSTERTVGRVACWVIFVLSVAYVPAMLAGFLANGGFDKPIADPYLAVMELLILLMAIPLVVLFACVHAYAPASRKTLSLSAFALVSVAVGITVCVHLVLLTAGRQLDAATSPGYDLLLSWTWPSVAFALDIASWDFFLGFGLLLAANAFTGSGPPRLVRRGLLVSGAVCLLGLVGAATGNMGVRDIGIAGYAVILPVVLLVMARVFGATPAAETPSSTVTGSTGCTIKSPAAGEAVKPQQGLPERFHP